jgi:hypothetical protein
MAGLVLPFSALTKAEVTLDAGQARNNFYEINKVNCLQDNMM